MIMAGCIKTGISRLINKINRRMIQQNIACSQAI